MSETITGPKDAPGAPINRAEKSPEQFSRRALREWRQGHELEQPIKPSSNPVSRSGS